MDGGAITWATGVIRRGSTLACSNALAKARTLPKRCLGSLASAVITTCSTSAEMLGTFSRSDGGDARQCLAAISVKKP